MIQKKIRLKQKKERIKNEKASKRQYLQFVEEIIILLTSEKIHFICL